MSRAAGRASGRAAPEPRPGGDPDLEVLRAEIEERLGGLPPFFVPALANPSVLSLLWRETLTGYLDNPLPARWKEAILAAHHKGCPVQDCAACRGPGLPPKGVPGWRPLVRMARAPREEPKEEAPREEMAVLAAEAGPLERWPEASSLLEVALVRCAASVSLDAASSERCQAELQRLLGPQRYGWLLAYLLYIRTCHFWMNAAEA